MEGLSTVVLAAGEGTRLRPLTTHRPKPMLPGATTPILEHVFDQLIEAGVGEITVVVGYGRNRVQSHFGSRFRDVPLRYVVQERQLGTGHALAGAESAVDGPCLVVYGDQIVDQRIIADVLAAHEADADAGGNDTVATLGVLERENVSDYGGVILADEGGGSRAANGSGTSAADGSGTAAPDRSESRGTDRTTDRQVRRVEELVERPQDDRHYHLNAGVYVLEPAAFAAIRNVELRAGERSLIDGLDALLANGAAIRGVVSSGLWVDATYPWDLLYLAGALFDAGVVDGAGMGDGTGVGDGTGLDDDGRAGSAAAGIHETAVLREPVAIAPDCAVGPGAVVGPYTALGENVTVGSNAVVERSVIDRDCRIGANATVTDAVTGVGVTIGAGSTIPGGPGDVRVGDRIHPDEDLGALLADRVTDGGGVTYAPGTVVGAGANIAPGSTVEGTIDDETEVRS